MVSVHLQCKMCPCFTTLLALTEPPSNKDRCKVDVNQSTYFFEVLSLIIFGRINLSITTLNFCWQMPQHFTLTFTFLYGFLYPVLYFCLHTSYIDFLVISSISMPRKAKMNSGKSAALITSTFSRFTCTIHKSCRWKNWLKMRKQANVYVPESTFPPLPFYFSTKEWTEEHLLLLNVSFA